MIKKIALMLFGFVDWLYKVGFLINFKSDLLIVIFTFSLMLLGFYLNSGKYILKHKNRFKNTLKNIKELK